ncbi:MAG: HD domain-containing phosphohydrolase [Actinomycetota bacterium]
MESAPTKGAIEPGTPRWGRRPGAALAVRVIAIAIPFLVALLAVRVLGRYFLRPDGVVGAVLWFGQAVAVGAAISAAADRGTRRLLPLATLLDLALVFPDEAPSRFGVALRAGSTKRLRDRSEQLADDGLGEDVQAAVEAALELVGSLGRHDRLTRGHTERVRAYADLIAEELGMSELERLHLAWGVLLHDVGKMAVPSEILNKEEPLTDDEWATLSRHPEAGRELVAPLEAWLGEWLRPVWEHHERWDGGGYPAGLGGTDISIGGRIVAVADAYDVITSKRSYKESMSPEAGRQEMVRCAGSQFDPEVVRAFVATTMRRRWAGGAFASLTELQSLGSSVGSAATSIVATGATAAVIAGAGPLGGATEVQAAVLEASSSAPVAVETTTTTTPPTTTEPLVLSPSPLASTTTTTAPAGDTQTTPPEATSTTVPLGSASSDTPTGDEPPAATTTEPPPPGQPAATTSTSVAPSSPPTTTAAAPTTTVAPSSSPTTTAPPTTTTAPPGAPATTTTTAPPTTTTTAPPTTTTTTTTTTTPPATTTTVPANPLTCEFSVVSSSGSGYIGSIRLTNTSSTKIDDWTATWRFQDGESALVVWTVRLVSSGDPVVVEGFSWNDELDPGETVGITYTVLNDGGAPSPPPTDLTANGAPCA